MPPPSRGIHSPWTTCTRGTSTLTSTSKRQGARSVSQTSPLLPRVRPPRDVHDNLNRGPGAVALGHTGPVQAHAVVHVLFPGQHRVQGYRDRSEACPLSAATNPQQWRQEEASFQFRSRDTNEEKSSLHKSDITDDPAHLQNRHRTATPPHFG